AGIVAQRLQRRLERQPCPEQHRQLPQEYRHVARTRRCTAARAARRQHARRGNLRLDRHMPHIFDAAEHLLTGWRVDLADDHLARRGHSAVAELRHPLTYRLLVTRQTSSIVVTPARLFATPSSIIAVIPSRRAIASSATMSVFGPMASRTAGVISITSNNPWRPWNPPKPHHS